MSATAAVHNRFWASMKQRYGTRWLEAYGAEPTKAWKDLLDRFRPDEIAEALAALANRPQDALAHPPTLDEFSRVLGKVAAGARARDGNDYVRGFWRSCIVWCLEGELIARGAVKQREDVEAYVAANYKNHHGEALRNLLNDLVEAEHRNQGQRTPGLFLTLSQRVKLIVELQQAGTSEAA